MNRPSSTRQQSARIAAIFRQRCAGLPIPVTRLADVYRVGYRAMAAGRDPEPEIVAFVIKEARKAQHVSR